MIVSGGQQRDSAIRIHDPFSPQTPFPSRLPPNIEQSSLWSTVSRSLLVIHFKYRRVYISIGSWAILKMEKNILGDCPLALASSPFSPDSPFTVSPLPTYLLLLKSLQSCPTLCDPIDGSPPGLPISRQEHWCGLPSPSPMYETET